MKSGISLGVRKSMKILQLFLNLALAAWSSMPAQSKKQQRSRANAVTATGCLEKVDQANEYRLKGDDGKTYILSGSNLAAHVGHKVTVSGTPTADKEKHSSKTSTDQTATDKTATDKTSTDKTATDKSATDQSQHLK